MVVAELFAKLGLTVHEAEFAKGEKLVEHLHHALEAFIGFEAVKGLTELVMHTVELGEQLSFASEKTGIATDKLQFLGYVAKLNGSSLEDVTHSLNRLAHGLDEAAVKGSGPAHDALARLRLTSAALAKVPTDEKLQMIAAQLSKLPDGAQKTALAMDLFGRSGADMIPTLNALGKHAAELQADFAEFGGGLRKEQTEALREFGDGVKRTESRLGLLKDSIVVALLPTLKDLMDGFVEWVKLNRELITDALQTVVEGLATAFHALGFVVSEVIVPVLQFLGEHMQLVQDILIGLGVVIAAFAIAAAASWAIAFAPILLIIGFIALLVAAVREVWDKITGGTGRVKDAIARVGAGFRAIWEDVKSVGERIYKFFAEDIPNAIRDAWQAAMNFIVEKALKTLDALEPIVAFAAGSGAAAATRQLKANVRASLEPQSAAIAGGGGGTTTNNVTVGDANITVTPGPGMSEKELGQAAADAADKHLKDRVKQALESIKGGRR